MMTEKEQKVLKQILKEGEKREKRLGYRYFIMGAIVFVVLIAILSLTIGLIFGVDTIIISGIFILSVALGGIGRFQRDKILYNALKKIIPDEWNGMGENGVRPNTVRHDSCL